MNITISIPEELIEQLTATGEPMQDVVLAAIRQYLCQNQENQIPPATRTWQLCGKLEIPTPNTKYIVDHDEAGKPITNYAEYVDESLY